MSQYCKRPTPRKSKVIVVVVEQARAVLVSQNTDVSNLLAQRLIILDALTALPYGGVCQKCIITMFQSTVSHSELHSV